MSYELYLYHHGVQGQKWGVRNGPPYPIGSGKPSLFKKQRTKAFAKNAHGEFMGQSRDNDIKIKAGTTANRIQAGNNSGKDGNTYVSFDKLDTFEYLVPSAANGAGGIYLGDKEGRIIQLKVQRDIIAPSYEKTMDAYIRTILDKDARKSMIDFYKTSELYRNSQRKEKVKAFIDGYKHLNKDEMLDKSYLTFQESLMANTVARRKFYDNLKAQGYNAVIDENDKKFGKGYAQTPMIVFEKDKNLKEVKSTKLTDDDYNYFKQLYYSGIFEDYDWSSKSAKNKTIKKWNKYYKKSQWYSDSDL